MQKGHTATASDLAQVLRYDVHFDDAPKKPLVTPEQLRGARVPSLCEQPAGTLVDGTLPENALGVDGGFVRILAGGGVSDMPDGGSVAIGDLDGDGISDGAIVVGCTSYAATNSIRYDVLAYTGGLTLLGTVPNNDPFHGTWGQVVTAIKIEEPGVLEVQSYRYEEADSHGGPSTFVIERFRYDGKAGFTLISSQNG